MRKNLRMLLLALTVLAVPAANALDMACVPGNYYYFQTWGGWKCYYEPSGTGCVLCSAEIVVLG